MLVPCGEKKTLKVSYIFFHCDKCSNIQLSLLCSTPGVPEVIPSLQRPRKRITELMLTSLQAQKSASNISNKQFLPIFLRSPKNILGNQLELTVNELKENAAVPTAASETLPSDLILRSIGYQSTCVDPEINFDQKKGLICNKAGRSR